MDTEDLSLAEKDDMEEDSKEFRNLNFPAKAHSLSSPTQEAWSFIENPLLICCNLNLLYSWKSYNILQ